MCGCTDLVVLSYAAAAHTRPRCKSIKRPADPISFSRADKSERELPQSGDQAEALGDRFRLIWPMRPCLEIEGQSIESCCWIRQYTCNDTERGSRAEV